MKLLLLLLIPAVHGYNLKPIAYRAAVPQYNAPPLATFAIVVHSSMQISSATTIEELLAIPIVDEANSMMMRSFTMRSAVKITVASTGGLYNHVQIFQPTNNILTFSQQQNEYVWMLQDPSLAVAYATMYRSTVTAATPPYTQIYSTGGTPVKYTCDDGKTNASKWGTKDVQECYDACVAQASCKFFKWQAAADRKDTRNYCGIMKKCVKKRAATYATVTMKMPCRATPACMCDRKPSGKKSPACSEHKTPGDCEKHYNQKATGKTPLDKICGWSISANPNKKASKRFFKGTATTRCRSKPNILTTLKMKIADADWGTCQTDLARAEACCKADTPECLGCMEGITGAEYCAINPLANACTGLIPATGCFNTCGKKAGLCPAVCGTGACCRKGFAKDPAICLRGIGLTNTQNHNCVFPKPMPVCCQAMTADCLSCQAEQSEEDYCTANPTTVGCPGVAPPTQPPAPSCPAEEFFFSAFGSCSKCADLPPEGCKSSDLTADDQKRCGGKCPAVVDCQKCAKDFADAGGCALMAANDPAAESKIPPGCDDCGPQAETECASRAPPVCDMAAVGAAVVAMAQGGNLNAADHCTRYLQGDISANMCTCLLGMAHKEVFPFKCALAPNQRAGDTIHAAWHTCNKPDCDMAKVGAEVQRLAATIPQNPGIAPAIQQCGANMQLTGIRDPTEDEHCKCLRGLERATAEKFKDCVLFNSRRTSALEDFDKCIECDKKDETACKAESKCNWDQKLGKKHAKHAKKTAKGKTSTPPSSPACTDYTGCTIHKKKKGCEKESRDACMWDKKVAKGCVVARAMTCVDYNGSRKKCTEAGCTYNKSTTDCEVARAMTCVDYNGSRKGCAGANCHYDKKTDVCMDSAPPAPPVRCADVTQRGGCKKMGCDWDRNLSTPACMNKNAGCTCIN